MILLRSLLLVLACMATGHAQNTGSWTMLGNGPEHSGYYPRQLGSGPFTLRWSKDFTTAINPAIVYGDALYLTTNGYYYQRMEAFALSASDGAERWSYPVLQGYALNPPAFASGKLYFQNMGDNTLFALNAQSGTLAWAAPFASQGGRFFAPVATSDSVFVNGGYYGGFYGFKASDGAQRFFKESGQDDGITPTLSGGTLYICSGGLLKAFNPLTGTELWSRNVLAGTDTSSQSLVVVAEGDNASMCNEGTLIGFNLSSKTRTWFVKTGFQGLPSIAQGVIYLVAGKEVRTYNAVTGAPGTVYSNAAISANLLNNQPLVTKDLILVSTETKTYVFRKSDGALQQTLPHGGWLVYAAGSLYIGTDSTFIYDATLAAYELTPTEADPAPSPLGPALPAAPVTAINPQHPPAATSAGWLASARYNGIAYFLFQNPAKIERYDLATQSWLTPISLASVPGAFFPCSAGIAITFGDSVFLLSLDGTAIIPLIRLPYTPGPVFSSNGVIYVKGATFRDRFTSIDIASGRAIDVKEVFTTTGGSVFAPEFGRIYGSSTGISPADVFSVSFDEEGLWGAQDDSPYHGDYPIASANFLSPDQTFLVNGSGIAYLTSDLTYKGSFGGDRKSVV